VIVEFSLIIAAFQLVSMKNGILYSAAFAVLLAIVGQISGIKNPTFVFYTNPILTDFALGILVFRLARTGVFPFSLPRRTAIALAAMTIAVCAVAVALRPFLWQEAPRLLALGLPMSLLLRCRLGATRRLQRFKVGGLSGEVHLLDRVRVTRRRKRRISTHCNGSAVRDPRSS
jgi:hypothetical protein